MYDNLISVSKILTALRLGLEVNWHYSNLPIDPSFPAIHSSAAVHERGYYYWSRMSQ